MLLRTGAVAGAIGILLTTGCATLGDAERAQLDTHFKRLASTPSTVVSEACVIFDGVSEDVVLRHASIGVARAAGENTAAFLQARGLRVERVVTPLACGAIDAQALAGMRMGDDEDATLSPVKVPMLLTDDVKNDATLPAVYQRLLRAVRSAEETLALEGDNRLNRPLNLADADIAVLQRQLGARDIWVVSAGGAKVSMVKSVGLAMVTAFVGGAAGGGGPVYYTSVQSGKGYDVALVDLDSNSLVWKKRSVGQAGDPTALDGYGDSWVAMMMDPLFPSEFTGVAGSPPVRRAPGTVATVQGDEPAAGPATAWAAPATARTPATLPDFTAPRPAPVAAPQAVAVAFTPPAASPLPRVAQPTPASVTLDMDADLLNRPTTAGKRLAALVKGDQLAVLSSAVNADGFWLRVQAPSGIPGWVRAERAN